MQITESRAGAFEPRMLLFALALSVAAGGCAAEAPAPLPQIEPTGAVAAPVAKTRAMDPRAKAAGVPRTGRAIVVNIPSFELIAFEDGEAVLESRVIVGKRSTPTPVMETETSVVRFRPTWTPTPRMVKSGKYRPGTRPPGPRNPLGFLAIRLEPGMLIYLHGTNRPQLFEEERRALSHGCMRVERWEDLAAFVLETDQDTVLGHAHGRRTFDMQTDGIPVLVRYLTRFPDADGTVREFRDIYGRGHQVIAAPTVSPS